MDITSEVRQEWMGRRVSNYGKTPLDDYRLQLPRGPRVTFVRASEGACRGMDPSLFFPGRGENKKIDAAKAVCAGCPVRAECLEYALVAGEKWGVWGGTSECERRRMRRGRDVA